MTRTGGPLKAATQAAYRPGSTARLGPDHEAAPSTPPELDLKPTPRLGSGPALSNLVPARSAAVMPTSRPGSEPVEFWVDGSRRDGTVEEFYTLGCELGR